MILAHTLVVIGVAILVSFLVLVLAYVSKLKLFTRIFSSTIAVLTVICLHLSLESMYGWPHQTEFPTGKFFLISYHVPEGQERINVWVIKRNKNKNWLTNLVNNDRHPRSISVYYTKQLHKQLQDIKKQAKGRPYPVEFKSVVGKKKNDNQDNQDKTEQKNYVLPDVTTERK
jgi:hypothetical protein